MALDLLPTLWDYYCVDWNNWLVDNSFIHLIIEMTEWVMDQFIICPLFNRLIKLFIDWLIDRLICWLIDWCQDYEQPLLEAKPQIIGRELIRVIFHKIREIYQCHKMFEIELTEIVRIWDSSDKIGDIFTASVRYTEY